MLFSRQDGAGPKTHGLGAGIASGGPYEGLWEGRGGREEEKGSGGTTRAHVSQSSSLITHLLPATLPGACVRACVRASEQREGDTLQFVERETQSHLDRSHSGGECSSSSSSTMIEAVMELLTPAGGKARRRRKELGFSGAVSPKPGGSVGFLPFLMIMVQV